MNIGIYVESAIDVVGGSECVAAVLAEALAQNDQVEIVHHKQAFSIEQLADFTGTALAGVRLRYVPPEPYVYTGYTGLRHVWRQYRNARTWRAGLSKPYDLFIGLVHCEPPFCHASLGVLLVLFPFDELRHITFRAQLPATKRALWPRVKLMYHDWEWAQRFATYQVKTANSVFTQEWTRRRWGIDCQVLYHPPATVSFRAGEKADIILSVGRFSPREGVSKRQLELVGAFRRMPDGLLPGWDYVCTGALVATPATCEYFEAVRSLAAGCRAHVVANVDRAELTSLYERAKLFWHATGYGDDDRHPELSEHFGLVTVEAMAAGCVPIVINKGGQREIVQHGVNGFLWDTLDELQHFTVLLAHDDERRARMAEAARSRAREFSRERFISRFVDLVNAVRPGSAPVLAPCFLRAEPL